MIDKGPGILKLPGNPAVVPGAGGSRSAGGLEAAPEADVHEEVAQGTADLHHVLPAEGPGAAALLGGSMRMGTSTKLFPAHRSLIRISAC